MCAGPVVRRRQLAVSSLPGAYGVYYTRARPAPLDRARVAGLAVRIRVPLSVARLGVRAAAPAHPDVAGLDRSRLLAGRIVEVRLDRRRGAAEAGGDLLDRQALELPVMTCQGHRAAALRNPIDYRV